MGGEGEGECDIIRWVPGVRVAGRAVVRINKKYSESYFTTSFVPSKTRLTLTGGLPYYAEEEIKSFLSESTRVELMTASSA